MAFVDKLRAYLALVDDASRAPEPLSRLLDPAWAEERFVSHCERRERAGETAIGAMRAPEIEAALRLRWPSRFVQALASRLRSGFLAAAAPEVLCAAVDAGLAGAVGITIEFESPLRSRALASAVDDVVPTLGQYVLDPWDATGIRYAAEVGLTSPDNASRLVSPIGRVFQRLTGREAIAWLLAVEVEQSTGPMDVWRAGRELARELSTTSEVTFDWREGSGERYALPTLLRLADLGVLSFDDDREVPWLAVRSSPPGMDLLGSVAARDTPFSLLAATLLEDQHRVVIASATGRPAPTPGIDAHVRQARFVAHELNNILTPLEPILRGVFDAIASDQIDVALARRDAVENALQRASRFVTELARTASLAGNPPEPFDLVAVVRDAVAGVDAGDTAMAFEHQGITGVLVTGHRDRAVVVFVNLLRNAVQAGATRVVLAIELAGSALRASVDDNGPGVPPERRRAIFSEGVTWRAGGSGIGLALVREVVETELRGAVSCETSPLGGARFTVTLPQTGSARP